MPTEYILIGPFFRTPTPKRLNSLTLEANEIPVALSLIASAERNKNRNRLHDRMVFANRFTRIIVTQSDNFKDEAA